MKKRPTLGRPTGSDLVPVSFRLPPKTIGQLAAIRAGRRTTRTGALVAAVAFAWGSDDFLPRPNVGRGGEPATDSPSPDGGNGE